MKEYFESLFSTPLMCAAQIMGFIAMISAVICFQQKDRKKILIFQILVTALWTLHFILLKNPTGAAINGMQAVRSVIYLKKEDNKWAQWLGWPVIFIVISVAIGIITWESPLSLLPVIATSLSTVSLWMKKPKTIRLLTVPVSVLWGIYDAVNRSAAGACNEIFTLVSIIIAIFRIDIKQDNNRN
jgi:hypothetical protein